MYVYILTRDARDCLTGKSFMNVEGVFMTRKEANKRRIELKLEDGELLKRERYCDILYGIEKREVIGTED